MATKYFDGNRWIDLGFQPLWTNKNPTSNFAPQTIELDLSKYRFVLIGFKYSESAKGTTSVIIRIGDYGTAIMTTQLSNSGAITIVRRAATVTKSGVEFEAGYSKSTTSTSAASASNASMIPIYICGIS